MRSGKVMTVSEVQVGGLEEWLIGGQEPSQIMAKILVIPVKVEVGLTKVSDED